MSALIRVFMRDFRDFTIWITIPKPVNTVLTVNPPIEGSRTQLPFQLTQVRVVADTDRFGPRSLAPRCRHARLSGILQPQRNPLAVRLAEKVTKFLEVDYSLSSPGILDLGETADVPFCRVADCTGADHVQV